MIQNPSVFRLLSSFVLLLLAGCVANPVTDNAQPMQLHQAAVSGDIAQLQTLLNNGADINARARVPVSFARKGVPGCKALHAAALGGSLEAFKLLLAKSADINEPTVYKDKPSLNVAALAARGGHLELVKFIYAQPGFEDRPSSFSGWTTLHSAAASRNLELVKFVLSKGYTVDQTNNKGFTPLLYAAASGSLEVFDYLLQQGANLRHVSNTGVTALHRAAGSGNLELVKLLVEKGLDYNATTNNSKSTPLHYAKKHNHQDIIDYLINKGAITSLRDSRGRTYDQMPSLRGSDAGGM